MKVRNLLWGLAVLACTPAPPPKSAALTSSDVKIHQTEHRPKLVKVERSADSWPALGAALVHGLDTASSELWARQLQQRLSAAGLEATVRSFPTGLVVSIPLTSAVAVNPVDTLRASMQALPVTAAHPAAPQSDPCALLTHRASPSTLAVGHDNVVLSAVGDEQALARVTTWYNATREWAAGEKPSLQWPDNDVAWSAPGGSPGELVVARRTPLRSRTHQAAYTVGARDSTLALVAHSYAGTWRLTEAQSHYVPGGACLAVRLQSLGVSTPTQAANVARAVSQELDWVLSEQTADEDPQLAALEALTAQDAAERTAWFAAVDAVRVGQASSTAAHYWGPGGDNTEFAARLAVLRDAKHSAQPIAHTSQDEPGQGHLWASLVNKCVVQREGALDAGHAISALTGVASKRAQHPLRVTTAWGDVGLLVAQPNRTPGAEDAAAEELARAILLFHRDSSDIADIRTTLAAALPRTPSLAFALKLATNGHPSWLTGLPTEESLLSLAPGTARAALESFIAGPLELKVLTTQSQTQAQRMAARLNHLLSGLRQRALPCLAPSARLQQVPVAGEYWVEVPEGSPAVLLYVLEGRFAPAVRRVANALSGTGGWLERGVPASKFPIHVSASGLGASSTLSALTLTIVAENDAELSDAVAQLRELIKRLTVANLGVSTQTSLRERLLPEQRLQHLQAAVVDEKALLEELLTRALPTATLVYVKPVQTQ